MKIFRSFRHKQQFTITGAGAKAEVLLLVFRLLVPLGQTEVLTCCSHAAEVLRCLSVTNLQDAVRL